MFNLIEAQASTSDANEAKRVGTMVFDYASGSLANSFTISDAFNSLSELEVKDLQDELNLILFKQLGTIDDAYNLVETETRRFPFSYSDETLFVTESMRFHYFIRLIPVLDAKSAIIAYLK